MKQYVWMIMVVLPGCKGMGSDPVKRFIAGTYVRAINTEFAKGSDTLILKLQSGNNYSILKRTGFQRIKNDQLLPKEYRQEVWTGVYHPEGHIMEEFKQGKVLQFDPAENKLLVGGSEYVKVKRFGGDE
jgi:hypothetical protein